MAYGLQGTEKWLSLALGFTAFTGAIIKGKAGGGKYVLNA